MGDAPSRPSVSRPRRVTLAAILLLIVATLILLYSAVGVLGLSQAGEQSGTVAPPLPSLVLFLAFPLAIGLGSAAAAVGMLRGAPWSAIIGGLASAALMMCGAVSLWIVWDELSMPGSFAALFVAPGLAAVVAGALALFGIVSSRAWFARH